VDEGARDSGATHPRGFLVIRIGGPEHRGQQQECKWRPQKSFDQDHSGEGIYVQYRPDASRHGHQRGIDRAGTAEQEQPRGDIENVRRAQRYDR
jgi:hypothetical protein